jgi:hypothetical protein
MLHNRHRWGQHKFRKQDAIRVDMHASGHLHPITGRSEPVGYSQD